jgi:hypothetical protein
MMYFRTRKEREGMDYLILTVILLMLFWWMRSLFEE